MDLLQNRGTNQPEWKVALTRIMLTLESSIETTLDVEYIKGQLDEMESHMPIDQILEIDIGEALNATLKRIKTR